MKPASTMARYSSRIASAIASKNFSVLAIVTVLIAAEHLQAAGRDGADEGLFDAGSVGGELQVNELVAQKLLRGVSDRAGAGRTQRGGAGRAQAGVGVKFGELALLPAHADDAHRRAGFSSIGCNGLGRSRREAGDAVEDVISPSAPVGGRAHGLAELAVVGNVDAHVFLRAHDFTDGRAQPGLQRRFVLRRDGFFRPHGAQVRRPRQAADMGGKNAFSASFHKKGCSNGSRRFNSSNRKIGEVSRYYE